MALDDIQFPDGDKQNFITELPIGTLNSPRDFTSEAGGAMMLLEPPASGGNIFIMSE